MIEKMQKKIKRERFIKAPTFNPISEQQQLLLGDFCVTKHSAHITHITTAITAALAEDSLLPPFLVNTEIAGYWVILLATY